MACRMMLMSEQSECIISTQIQLVSFYMKWYSGVLKTHKICFADDATFIIANYKNVDKNLLMTFLFMKTKIIKWKVLVSDGNDEEEKILGNISFKFSFFLQHVLSFSISTEYENVLMRVYVAF